MPEIGYVSNFNGKDFVYEGIGKGWVRIPDSRFALVRMELVGEPTITPDGKSIQLARFPWQRPDDASHGISVNDIVEIENGTRRYCRCSMPKTEAI